MSMPEDMIPGEGLLSYIKRTEGQRKTVELRYPTKEEWEKMFEPRPREPYVIYTNMEGLKRWDKVFKELEKKYDIQYTTGDSTGTSEDNQYKG